MSSSEKKTDEKQREADNGTGQPAEADNGTGQPAEADNGTGQAAEADNETGQPAEADNGAGQPAGADNGTGQPAEADDGTLQPAEADDGTGQPAEEKKPPIRCFPRNINVERPLTHIEKYNWPEKDEEFDGRNVVVIGINGSRESEDAFDWYMTTLHHKKDLVVVVYALEIGPKLGLSRLGLLGVEDWYKEMQRFIDTQTALHFLYRRRFIGLEEDFAMNGAIVSRKGEPGDLILTEARERRAAYIILGRRSRDDNLHKMGVGETCAYVYVNANCPVHICKTDPNPRREQTSSSSTSMSM